MPDKKTSDKIKRNSGTKDGKDCCSFCGKECDDNDILVKAKDGVAICGECIRKLSLACGYTNAEGGKVSATKKGLEKRLPDPVKIKEQLDEYVIGQDYAKIVLSVAVCNHYKRIALEEEGNSVEIGKSNVLMLGPTGSGKTYLARTLAKILDVPFTIADATSFTEAGYVGEDVEGMLTDILAAADGNVKEAEHGIIYIDEVDKIASCGDGAALSRDVSGEGVQQALLKILEGTEAIVPQEHGHNNPFGTTVTMQTKDILFICGGAFDGLDKIVSDRLNKKAIGFTNTYRETDREYILRNVMPEDLRKYGFTPEFIGRMPVTIALDAPDEEMLARILTEPKNALIKQYQALLKMDGINLTFTDDAVRLIAEYAYRNKTGARGLRSILEQTMTMIMYHASSFQNKNIVITPELIRGNYREKTY